MTYGSFFSGIRRRIRCGGIGAVAWLALAAGTAHAQAHVAGVQEKIPATEYQALVDLYNSAGGTNWYYQTGWLDPSAIAWTNIYIEGVVTDANGNVTQQGHVTFLGLSYFNMRGSIPASLGNLSALRLLWLDRNQLSGSIPASLGNLSALRNFSLEHNQLCGNIPSSLGNLTNLTYLNIANNYLVIDTQGRGTLDSLRSHGATVVDQPQGTCPTPTCSVLTLTPITDPVALQFETGNTLDTSHLTAATQADLSCLTTRVLQAGGQLTLNSAYRPPAYQSHLREVWDKWQQLKDGDTLECQGLRTQVQTEINYHSLQNLQTRPASPTGPHTQGIAVDVNFNATGLPRPTVIGLASQCGLAHPLPATDPVHFIFASPPLPEIRFGPSSYYPHEGVGLRGAETTSSLETPPVAINVSQQNISGHMVYNYQVINNNTLPIVSVKVGYDSNTQMSELSVPPLDWDYFNGLPSGSAAAPEGWNLGVVTQEESEYLSLSWRTSDAAQRIMPGQTKQGFGVVLPRMDNLYLTSHWTVIFSDGTVMSAPLQVSVLSSGSALQFSATNYEANEGDGTAKISVVRSGDTSNSATVDFATSDGTATQGRNYTTASGTLTFPPGEASKLFTVVIIDDVYIEGNHTINLNLSNAVGATVGNPSAATLTIIDNDTDTSLFLHLVSSESIV